MFIDWLLIAQQPAIDCSVVQLNPIVVCSKRRLYSDRLKRVINYIKLSDNTEEFSVNRCTYLANELGKPFVFEQDKKWCNKEKQLLMSVWTY